jgi:hypothetical protein
VHDPGYLRKQGGSGKVDYLGIVLIGLALGLFPNHAASRESQAAVSEKHAARLPARDSLQQAPHDHFRCCEASAQGGKKMMTLIWPNNQLVLTGDKGRRARR